MSEHNVADSQIRILSLCTGGGMLDEGLVAGLELLGLQGRILCASERDAYVAATLMARMEDQSLEPFPLWAGDFEGCRWERFRGLVDCLVAGFPCQPWSAAGKREGTDDERWLWPGIVGVIQKTQPWFCWFENVPGFVSASAEQDINAMREADLLERVRQEECEQAMANRADRLRLCGNGVCAVQAAVAFALLVERVKDGRA